MSGIDEARKQIPILARHRKSRTSEFRATAPTVWRPGEVRDPGSGEPFTEEGAWQLIADLVERGHPLEEVELKQPPGKKGYVMLVRLAHGEPQLYIKLQLQSGRLLCRSFHHSESGANHE